MILPRDNEEKARLLQELTAERFQDPPCRWCEKADCANREKHRRLYAQRETTWHIP